MRQVVFGVLICLAGASFATASNACESAVCNIQSECVKSLGICEYSDTYLNSKLDITFTYKYQVEQQRTCLSKQGQISGTNLEIRENSKRGIRGETREKALANAEAACEASQRVTTSLLGECRQ